MAFLRIKKRGERRYHYIVESRRIGAAVRQKTLEFLGDRPDPKRLKRAMDYWGVKRETKDPGRSAGGNR
jgi:hypothetical protein